MSDQAREIERVARKLVARLFGERGRVDLALSVARESDGAEHIVCSWTGSGWEGDLNLRRVRGRELSARDLGGVLKVLRDVESGD